MRVTDRTALSTLLPSVQLMMNEMMSAMHPLSLTTVHWCLTARVCMRERKSRRLIQKPQSEFNLTMTNVKVPPARFNQTQILINIAEVVTNTVCMALQVCGQTQ